MMSVSEEDDSAKEKQRKRKHRKRKAKNRKHREERKSKNHHSYFCNECLVEKQDIDGCLDVENGRWYCYHCWREIREYNNIGVNSEGEPQIDMTEMTALHRNNKGRTVQSHETNRTHRIVKNKRARSLIGTKLGPVDIGKNKQCIDTRNEDYAHSDDTSDSDENALRLRPKRKSNLKNAPKINVKKSKTLRKSKASTPRKSKRQRTPKRSKAPRKTTKYKYIATNKEYINISVNSQIEPQYRNDSAKVRSRGNRSHDAHRTPSCDPEVTYTTRRVQSPCDHDAELRQKKTTLQSHATPQPKKKTKRICSPIKSHQYYTYIATKKEEDYLSGFGFFIDVYSQLFVPTTIKDMIASYCDDAEHVWSHVYRLNSSLKREKQIKNYNRRFFLMVASLAVLSIVIMVAAIFSGCADNYSIFNPSYFIIIVGILTTIHLLWVLKRIAWAYVHCLWITLAMFVRSSWTFSIVYFVWGMWGFQIYFEELSPDCKRGIFGTLMIASSCIIFVVGGLLYSSSLYMYFFKD